MTINDKIRSYEPMIQSIMHKLNILYDRDEYMQIGRIAVLESIKKFDSSKASCSESQFVYTLIRQHLIDEIRKVSRYQERFALTENNEAFQHSLNDYYQLENLAVKVLNAREYRWYTLALAGHSLKETAEILAVSVSTVKNIRRSAREKLVKFRSE